MMNNSNYSQSKASKLYMQWSKPIIDGGYTVVPKLLLENISSLNITPAEFLVLVALTQFKFDNREPYPSVSALCRLTNLSDSSVRNYLARLESKKLLQRIHVNGGTSFYDLTSLIDRLNKIELQVVDPTEKLEESEQKDTEPTSNLEGKLGETYRTRHQNPVTKEEERKEYIKDQDFYNNHVKGIYDKK